MLAPVGCPLVQADVVRRESHSCPEGVCTSTARFRQPPHGGSGLTGHQWGPPPGCRTTVLRIPLAHTRGSAGHPESLPPTTDPLGELCQTRVDVPSHGHNSGPVELSRSPSRPFQPGDTTPGLAASPGCRRTALVCATPARTMPPQRPVFASLTRPHRLTITLGMVSRSRCSGLARCRSRLVASASDLPHARRERDRHHAVPPSTAAIISAPIVTQGPNGGPSSTASACAPSDLVGLAAGVELGEAPARRAAEPVAVATASASGFASSVALFVAASDLSCCSDSRAEVGPAPSFVSWPPSPGSD